MAAVILRENGRLGVVTTIEFDLAGCSGFIFR